jgi:hypothetical protein
VVDEAETTPSTMASSGGPSWATQGRLRITKPPQGVAPKGMHGRTPEQLTTSAKGENTAQTAHVEAWHHTVSEGLAGPGGLAHPRHLPRASAHGTHSFCTRSPCVRKSRSPTEQPGQGQGAASGSSAWPPKGNHTHRARQMNNAIQYKPIAQAREKTRPSRTRRNSASKVSAAGVPGTAPGPNLSVLTPSRGSRLDASTRNPL